ncbi:murein hydrolase activator EnvC family protein [Marinimicrobium alkaliphilum]|uniref:murein hydrolase activator EnvC family protein n=1 Tax=Marinimicrobium alkaliphilum TaxID=2202654 RepID=UPI000DB90AE8|nr:peptidoglycan DD-metalloendopeptidase family protein [Marinimicrobium alkaliphilum]
MKLPSLRLRQRLTRLSTGAALATALALTAPTLSANEDYDAQMRELQRNIDSLQRELRRVRDSRSDLESELERSESEIGELLQRIERIEREIRSQEDDLQGLRREREQLRQARATQQTQVAEQVRAAYQLGQQSQLKLLLNQESPERISRLLRYHDYFLAARAEKISAYLATIDELDALEPRIERQTRQLVASRGQLEQRHGELRASQQQRQQTIARLNQSITSKDDELGQMRGNRERLQALMDEVARTITDIPLPGDGAAFTSRRGQLPWPTEGEVAHRYGSARVGDQLQWNGVFINAPEGEAVRAVHHGRVVFSDYFRGHGLLVILDHGEGYMSLYAHNQSLMRETGDWVNAGEPVARVGNSGGQARTGLYFEIRHRGQPTNPAPWLARA